MDTYPSGSIRVSDAERDRAVAELSEHFQAGRLTMAEFDERSDQALHAKVGSDLAVLFTDLPRVRRQAAPVPDRLPATAPPPSRRLGPLVAVLASALVAIAVSLLSVTEPHHHFVVVVPIVLWVFIVRRLARVYGDDHRIR